MELKDHLGRFWNLACDPVRMATKGVHVPSQVVLVAVNKSNADFGQSVGVGLLFG